MLSVELLFALSGYFCGDRLKHSSFIPFVTLYGFSMVILALYGWVSSGMSKSMAETGEIDAIAWLLKSTSSQDPTFFKKAGQMVVGSQYQPRLLKSLMPLLSLLITSHHPSREPKTTPHRIPERSNSDPSSLSSKDMLKLLKEKNIDLNKQRFKGLPVSLNPVPRADPTVATTSHHVLNSDSSSFLSRAKARSKSPEVQSVQNIELNKQHEGLPISSSSLHADPIAITSAHVPVLFNSDPSSSSFKAGPKLPEKKNTPLKKVQSNGPQTVLNPVEIDPQATNEEAKTLQHLEIYVLCLAALSDFKHDEGSYRCLWEDAKRHPQLEEDLRTKLVELAKYPPGRLRSAAIQVLKNYGLDSQGDAINDLEAHARPRRWCFTQDGTADRWRERFHLP